MLWHGAASDADAPLLLCLHGRAEGAIAFVRTSGIGPAAAAAGFRVAVPQGSGLVADWIVERDLDAIGALTMGLHAAGRCVLIGMSQGARLAAALVRARPDDFVGMVAVAGVPGPLPRTGRGPARLYVHGDLDSVVPAPVAADHVAAVAAAAGCGPREFSGQVAGVDRAAEDSGVAARTVYPHPGGADVSLVRLPAGGHVWPGSPEPQPGRFGPVAPWPATAAVIAFASRCVAGASG
jgi:poly(3-hydroxybutyrate) depolymerase